MSNIHHGVLVIGAGPVGLVTALCLSEYNVPVTIVEKHHQVNDQSKALALSPIALAQLDHMIPTHRIGESAREVSRMEISYENRRVSSIGLDRLLWKRNKMLVQTQAHTENDIINELENRGVSVLRGTRVVECEYRNNKCIVKYKKYSQIEQHEFDYVVGCEGKNSLIRDCIGATMTHQSYDMYLILCDYELKTSMSKSSAHYFLYEDLFIVMVPLYDNVWRIVVKQDGDACSRGSISLLKNIVRDKLDGLGFVGRCLWNSVAPLYVSHVDEMQKDSVFIAGDSAHLYSPIGGAGMNTGICDALNLGWKLAFHIKGYTNDDSLLRSYSEERGPVIKEIAEITDRSTKLISRLIQSGPLVDAFLPQMANRNIFRQVLPVAATGLDLKYDIESSDNAFVGSMHWACEIAVSFVGGLNAELSKNIIVFKLNDGHQAKSFDSASTLGRLSGVIEIVILVSDDLNGIDEHSIEIPSDAPMVMTIGRELFNSIKPVGSIIAIRPDGIIFSSCEDRSKDILFNALSKVLKPLTI